MSEYQKWILPLFVGWTVYRLGALRAEIHNLREAWRDSMNADRLLIGKLDQEIRKLKGEESSYVELAKRVSSDEP